MIILAFHLLHGFAGLREPQPGLLPSLCSADVAVFDVTVNGRRLFIRHRLQFLADERLLEVNEGRDVVRVVCTRSRLLGLVCLGGFRWRGGRVTRLGSFGVGLLLSLTLRFSGGWLRVRGRREGSRSRTVVVVVVVRLLEEFLEGCEGRGVTRLVQSVEFLDLAVNGGAFTVVKCGVCLRWLEGKWSAVGLARKVKNVAGIRSLDTVAGVVPKPCSQFLHGTNERANESGRENTHHGHTVAAVFGRTQRKCLEERGGHSRKPWPDYVYSLLREELRD